MSAMGIDNTGALVLYQWLNYIVGHELTRIKSSRHPRNTKMGEVKIATTQSMNGAVNHTNKEESGLVDTVLIGSKNGNS